MKRKYLLIGISRSHDEIIKVFKGDVSTDVINEHLKSYLSDIDCLQDLTDRFDAIQKQLKDRGYDHDTFHVIKDYLLQHKDTFVTFEDTDLIES